MYETAPLPASVQYCIYVAHQCIEAMKQPSRPGHEGTLVVVLVGTLLTRSLVLPPKSSTWTGCSMGGMLENASRLGFDGNSDRYFGCFWVEDMRVVGCFLEGGSDEEKTICEKIAEMRPRLTRMHKFRSLECEDFLADPLAMEPPELGPGEFNAELDAKYIALAFDKYGRDGQAKTQAMGDLMRDLGADWDAEEEKEALRALDPLGSNRSVARP